MGIAGCTESSSGGPENVRIVASDDGTVEVIVQRPGPQFALAATGPVARNFTEQVRGDRNRDPLDMCAIPERSRHALSVSAVGGE